MASVKYLVFLTCLNLGIAEYPGDITGWKTVNVHYTSAADDTIHANDRSKRQANSTLSYTVELLMVIDFSLFQFWEERVRDEVNITASQVPQDAVKNKIRKFYASMGESINFRFQNISDPYFAISVEVVDIFIADTEIASYWTETSKNISKERNIYIEGDRSLESFTNWTYSLNNLTRHDHAMLFTRYNIQYNNRLISGLTSGHPVCDIKSASLVQDHFNSISATSAARLLGYSLGARSDGDGNLCSPSDNYIMSPVNAPGKGDTALNPWRFSTCSVQAFSTFLTGLNSTQNITCLQTDDAAAINDERAFPGSEYPVDDQCRFIRDNSSVLCRANYEGDFSNICTNMLCSDTASGTCAHVLPADGLSCGSGKWCENGRCVDSSRAPNNTAICLFGDAAAFCSSLYPSFLRYCYNESNYIFCCDTCSRWKNNVSGCEFGDHEDCSQVTHISRCANETLQLCCSTCAILAANACSAGFFRSTEGTCQACNIGTYQPYSEHSSCISCPNGTTTLDTGSNSSTQCVVIGICSAGFFLNNLTSCQACRRGTYQPLAGQAFCISCQTGTVTLQAGSTSSTQCVATCSSGFFRTTNGSCDACPVGTYQSQTEQSSCLSCPTGTTTNQVASTSQTQCVAVCSAGYFLDNLDSCQACPIGTYQSSAGQASCTSCQIGTVTLQAGSTSSTQCVVECSSGFFRTTSGNCQACPAGTYQASIEQSFCYSCPTGTSTNQTASTSQTQCVVNNCPAGTYQAFSGSPCIPCAAGNYQPHPRQTECIQCPTGTYQPNITSTECIQCGPGSYQNTIGSSSCISCNSGAYQSDVGQTSCILCTTGTYQPKIGTSTKCSPCNPGSYQNEIGSSSCVLCEIGTYQPNAGQSACIPCPSGTYQGQKGSTNCSSCEVGTYQPDRGKAACFHCPSGTYQEQKGSTNCSSCEVGTYQPDLGKAACIACPSGTYQGQKGSTSCSSCAVGTYQPDLGKAACIDCPSGTYQDQKGSTNCSSCKVGTYQPDRGKAACIACPSGTYQGQQGSTNCSSCEVGTYQPELGKAACNACPSGTYQSSIGGESCRPCEIGTFQNSTGQSFCFPCPNKHTTQQDGEQSVRACFQGYCPEYRYTIYVSTYNISVIIPSTKINQTGYSWNRCKKDSSKALVSAFCQNISRTEAIWTQDKVECTPEPEIQDDQTSPISEQLHTISKIDVNDTGLVNILQKTNALIKSVDVLTPVDVGYLADILDNVNMVDTVSKEVLNATLDVINTLLSLNSTTNQSAQESPGVANRILKIVEDITSKTEGGTVDNPITTIKPNIAVTVWEQIGGKLIGINVTSGKTDGKQDNLVNQLQQEPAEMDRVDDAIYFQPHILNGTKNKLVMTALWNDALFITGSDRYKVVSKIMAAKLFRNGVFITNLTNNYVISVFLANEEDSRVVCAYWNYTLNQNGGDWASDGCNYTRKNERHVCTCNHLTNFAVLVDLDANKIPPEHARALEIITFVGLIISIIGLSLTILTFICFRHLRRGRGQQTLFCLCIPMVCYSIVFLVGIQRTEHYAPCIVVSVLIHYFILASFMWMLVEGILQYLRFVKVLGTYIPNFLIKTSIPAWGIPLVPVIVLLAYDYNLYYGGSGFCWMKLEALYYAFVLPVCLIVLVNAVIFTIVMFNIFRRPKGMKINQSERKMIVLNLQAGISVFIVLGLTWIFGVVALGGAKLTFQYIFVILNAFQGFFIFLMFTAREKQVRDQWIRFCCRRPTGYFTSFERKSSSQDTFTTNVSGRKLSSSSSSFTDNRDYKLSSSSQDHRRRSSLSQTNESAQDHMRRNSSSQQLERDGQSGDSVEKEIAFSSLQEQKKTKTSLGKYMKTSKGNKYKSSNKDDAHELKKTSKHSKSNVTTWEKYLSKSTPDHTNSKQSLADPNGRQNIKGGHLSRSAPDESRSNIVLFNSIGRNYTSTNRDDIEGEMVLSPFGRSVDGTHATQTRRHITQFRHDDAYF